MRRFTAGALASICVLAVACGCSTDKSSAPSSTPPPTASGYGPQTVLPFTGLNEPEGVALDSAGNVYVADSQNFRVLKLPAGATTPTQLPFTGLLKPQGVAVDRAGAIYVADYAGRVLKLPAGASTPTELPFKPAPLKYLKGVAVDSAGSVYVADYGNNRVLKLAAGRAPRPSCPSPASTTPRVWRWTAPAPSTSPTPATAGC